MTRTSREFGLGTAEGTKVDVTVVRTVMKDVRVWSGIDDGEVGGGGGRGKVGLTVALCCLLLVSS